MSLLLLSAWSTVLILFLMGITKYRWTRPPITWMVLFFLAGIASTMPALAVNMLINSQTRFHMMGPNVLDSIIGFGVGPGMGEEFFKFSCGLLVLLFAVALGAPLTPASRLHGFVLVGLGFAVIENIFYAFMGNGTAGMLLRGVLPVPLHAAMGFIQGVVVNVALRKRHSWLIFPGYLLCMGIHWAYDVIVVHSGPILGPLAGGAIVASLVLFSVMAWLLTSEEEPDTDDEPDEWMDREPTPDY